jgi:hypothetical protein
MERESCVCFNVDWTLNGDVAYVIEIEIDRFGLA